MSDTRYSTSLVFSVSVPLASNNLKSARTMLYEISEIILLNQKYYSIKKQSILKTLSAPKILVFYVVLVIVVVVMLLINFAQISEKLSKEATLSASTHIEYSRNVSPD